MVFFHDVTDDDKFCTEHVRPHDELMADLLADNTARYNFITPSLCDDMHGLNDKCLLPDIRRGDDWLQTEIPRIQASKAYQDGGAIFITWDECSEGVLDSSHCEAPIGMIVLSPMIKAHGYSDAIPYDHSSTLRTVEEIFGVTPLLGDASCATDLGDLFTD